MQIKPGNFCPLLQKECIGPECSWFTQLRGSDPNTGKEIDEWGCAISWLPILIIENSKEAKSTAVAVESFRNEMSKSAETNLKVLEAAAKLHNVIANADASINTSYLPTQS